jgi:hypothetical protein
VLRHYCKDVCFYSVTTEPLYAVAYLITDIAL